MKINWNQNPLLTTVELDDHDKEKLKLKRTIEHILDEIGSVIFSKNSDQKDDHSRLEKLYDYEVSDDYIKEYENYLQESHCGDCTCVPMSCVKCYVEDLMDISTIKGCGKHSLYKIDAAFHSQENCTIDQAIEDLRKDKPYGVKPESWEKHTQEEYESHFPR